MRSCGRIGARLLNGTVSRSLRMGSAMQQPPLMPARLSRVAPPVFRSFSTPSPEDPKSSKEEPKEAPKEETREEAQEERKEEPKEEPKAEEAKEPEEDKTSKLSHEELVVEYKKLEEAHKQAEETIKTTKNQLAYALADIENVRKIAKKDVSNARDFALKGFAKDLLDVADNCERAISIFPPECKEKGHAMNGIYVGLEMTQNVMLKAFEKHGLSKIEIVEKETLFDPNVHDALFQQPMEGMESDIVFAVVKSGYTINGRVLRAAQVGVSSE